MNFRYRPRAVVQTIFPDYAEWPIVALKEHVADIDGRPAV